MKELSPYQKRKRKYGKKFHKLWRIREKDKIKIQRHDYYERNKEQIKVKCKDYYAKNKVEIFQQRKELKEKRRKELETFIGDKCLICGSTKIIFHEIHGNKHPLPRGDCKKIHSYMLEHKEDFAPLCRKCHGNIHYIAQAGNSEKAIELIRLTNPKPQRLRD